MQSLVVLVSSSLALEQVHFELQVLMVAHIGLLLCSPPDDRSCLKLCLRRQIIKNYYQHMG